MAEPADINVDELRRRARRRLVGAVVLALGVAVIVPMLLETEQKPLGEDVSVKIPPIDDSTFVNRLSENRAKGGAQAPAKDEGSKEAPAASSTTTPPTAPERPSRYDTRIPEVSAPGASPAPTTRPVANGENPAATSSKAPEVKSAGSSAATPVTDASKPSSPAQAAAETKSAALAPNAAPPASNAGASVPKVAPAASQEGFAVQLAAFADDKGANALAGRLKKAGYAAYTEPLKTSKGTLWRVRVGPYPSREAAVAARDKLKTEGQSGIVAAVK